MLAEVVFFGGFVGVVVVVGGVWKMLVMSGPQDSVVRDAAG